jgi:hypothetical protein
MIVRALLVLTLLAVPFAADAVDIYPDLVSGSYTFGGQPSPPAPAVDPTVTPTASLGVVRVDGAPLDQGVLNCQVVNPTDYFATLTFTVTLTDLTQNAEVRVAAFPYNDCTGPQSPWSDDAARMFLVPPSKPLLLP